MKTIKPIKQRNKNFSRYLLTFLLSAIFTVNISAKTYSHSDVFNNLDIEKQKLEEILFAQLELEYIYIIDLEINEIEIIELEEEVELGFDTSKFLPNNFNALKGKNDLDWNTIELIEIQEDIEINFDTKQYLPEGFNPYKGMRIIKNKIEAIH